MERINRYFLITMIFVLIGYLVNAAQAFAADDRIVCSSERLNKEIVIDGTQVTFNSEWNEGRAIASVRTRFVGQGFTKVLNLDGHKYKIHVEDVGRFSEVDDYIAIRSPQGHEITYPLSCHR